MRSPCCRATRASCSGRFRYRDELRPAEPAPGKADAKLTRLVTRLIEARTEDWTADLVSDPVQAKLEKIIAGKKSKAKKAEPKPSEAPKPTGDNVVSIMDALKRSLAAGKKATLSPHGYFFFGKRLLGPAEVGPRVGVCWRRAPARSSR